MALPDRISMLYVDPPPNDLPSLNALMKDKLLTFRQNLEALMQTEANSFEDDEDDTDIAIANLRLDSIQQRPESLVRGSALTKALAKLERA